MGLGRPGREQAAGKTQEVSPAADVYALGALLYELLTGRPPFKAATMAETLLQVLSEEPVSPGRLQPKLPHDLETVCLKCLHKESHKRYPSAVALGEDLQRFQAGEPIQARPVGNTERAWRWCRRNPALAGSLAAVVLMLLLGTAVSLYFAVMAEGSARTARAALQEKADALRRAEAKEDVLRELVKIIRRRPELASLPREALLAEFQKTYLIAHPNAAAEQEQEQVPVPATKEQVSATAGEITALASNVLGD
jgi:serine/threonine protein kinase